MKFRQGVILLICLFCRSTERYERSQLVVWDVGQGSWATYITTTTCDHFDVGGETSIPLLLSELCMTRKNRLFLSHSDWDHISHLKDIYRSWKGLCLNALPRDLFLKSLKTQKFLNNITICKKPTEDLHAQSEAIIEVASPSEFKRPNDLSRIFVLKKKWLFPGDSTTAAEKRWLQNLKDPLKIEVLILGHHGSRTSTSADLLSRLKSLKAAVSSSRHKRYGHPHGEVRTKLRLRRIPLLSTEEWGSLVFEL